MPINTLAGKPVTAKQVLAYIMLERFRVMHAGIEPWMLNSLSCLDKASSNAYSLKKPAFRPKIDRIILYVAETAKFEDDEDYRREYSRAQQFCELLVESLNKFAHPPISLAFESSISVFEKHSRSKRWEEKECHVLAISRSLRGLQKLVPNFLHVYEVNYCMYKAIECYEVVVAIQKASIDQCNISEDQLDIVLQWNAVFPTYISDVNFIDKVSREHPSEKMRIRARHGILDIYKSLTLEGREAMTANFKASMQYQVDSGESREKYLSNFALVDGKPGTNSILFSQPIDDR